MAYDQITKDLCRKAQQDVAAVVDRTATLLPDPADRMMIAISASVGSLASAAGFVVALTEQSTGNRPEPGAAIDGLWETLRPLLLAAAGGDEAPYQALLASAQP